MGASGDLAPLSHLALGLMGEGKMWSPETGWADASDVSGVCLHVTVEPLYGDTLCTSVQWNPSNVDTLCTWYSGTPLW